MPIFIFSHIIILCLSNIFVLFPVTLYGVATTYGAFTYPFIFVLTDLATRIYGPSFARHVIYTAFIPGLILSFVLSSLIQYHSIPLHLSLPLRVAIAGIVAYIIGQLMDVVIFTPLRKLNAWWVAPTIATFVGNIIDTFCFFAVAFYHSSNDFLSQHWPEIAMADLLVKIVISQVAFVPIYGLLFTRLKISPETL